MTLSVTNHGDMSSRLVFAFEFVFLIASLLLITLALVPFVSSRESVLLILLLREFLLFTELDLERLEASTGRRLADCPDFLPTLDNDRVTGLLLANEVSILLSIASAEVSISVCKLDSGELLGVPVDMGESTVLVLLVNGGTTGSKKGFLDLVGDEKGFDRPIVANFCPVKGLFVVCVEVGRGTKDVEDIEEEMEDGMIADDDDVDG